MLEWGRAIMILWYSICQLYKRRKITILTIIMSAIGLAVIYFAMINYEFYQYPKKQAEKLISYDIENVYRLSYQMLYVPIGGNELEQILEFDNSLEDIDGVSLHGMFFVENNDVENNKFYIQRSLIKLCDLRNIDGKKLNYDVGDGEYGFAVLGYNYANQYPVGSVFDNKDGNKYIVTDYLQKNSAFIPDDDIGDSSINLDDVIILDYDYALSKNISMLYNGLNSYYIVMEDGSILDDAVSKANEEGLHIYGIYNIEDKYDREIKNYMWANGESYYFPIILYVAAMISLLMSSLISLYTNKKDMGIMLANGISKRQLVAMISVQNAIKVTIAAMIAVFLWWYFYFDLTGAMSKLVIELIPWGIIVVLVSYLVINIISVMVIRDKKPYELLR